MGTETYTMRVIEERDDLKVKVDKLTKFLDSEQFTLLPFSDKILLRCQLDAMHMYLEVLNERVGLFMGVKS